MSPNNAVETDARLRLAPLTANVRHTEESVKPHTKAAAVTAVKWAAGLSAGFILGPIVMGLASGTAAPGEADSRKTDCRSLLVPNSLLWPLGLGSVNEEESSSSCGT